LKFLHIISKQRTTRSYSYLCPKMFFFLKFGTYTRNDNFRAFLVKTYRIETLWVNLLVINIIIDYGANNFQVVKALVIEASRVTWVARGSVFICKGIQWESKMLLTLTIWRRYTSFYHLEVQNTFNIFSQGLERNKVRSL